MPEREAASASKPAGASPVVIIGTLATLIGALVGLLGVLHTLGWIGAKPPQPQPTVVVVPSGMATEDLAALMALVRTVQAEQTRMSSTLNQLAQTASGAASAAAATKDLNILSEEATAIEKKLARLQSPLAELTPEERQVDFERVKTDLDKLSAMQKSMSDVLNTMEELSKRAIRHIKV